ncbi:sporulation protein YunB [Moorella sulfitireducens]|uniref:sporulation protein YunB n=1 Tax=Neomoorella sulfitireducens TaxID=2972948 RepID=UPI0021ACAD40|nr:sporulation protein YunB [Moorella sulfitireducens]
MRRRWRRPGREPKSMLALVLVAGLLVVSLLEWRLHHAMETLAYAQARWAATEAIQQAVLEKITGQVSYNNLIQPGSSDGRVVFMQADALSISRLQAQAQLAIQEYLAQLKGKTYYLPLGQVLGLELLAAYGPRVPLRFIPMGIVNVNVGDTFEATGINQTRHRIFLQVESVIQVIAPFTREEVKVTSTIPVVEAIIVGPVPQTYISLGSDLVKGILRTPQL